MADTGEAFRDDLPTSGNAFIAWIKGALRSSSGAGVGLGLAICRSTVACCTDASR